MKKGGGIGRVVAGGLAGGMVAAAAVAVWVAAAFWNWSFLGSSNPGPGQKVFMYVVSPGMLGAATVPVSMALGAGRRRVAGISAVVAGAACVVCVMGVEDWVEFPWQLVLAACFAVPGVSALAAVCGRDGLAGRSVSVIVGMLAAGVVFGVVAVVMWGFAESGWFYAALFAASWLVFPVGAAAMSEHRIGGEG